MFSNYLYGKHPTNRLMSSKHKAKSLKKKLWEAHLKLLFCL